MAFEESKELPSKVPAVNLFEVREARTLEWSNINVSVVKARGVNNKKKILDGVWGQVPAGQVTAILGPCKLCFYPQVPTWATTFVLLTHCVICRQFSGFWKDDIA